MGKIESVQYFAALAVSGAWRGTSKELGRESLGARRWCRRLVFMYKFINNLSPEYCTLVALFQHYMSSTISSELSH